MIRLIASVVLLALVAKEAMADVPDVRTLVVLGLLLLLLAPLAGSRAKASAVYDGPERRRNRPWQQPDRRKEAGD